ncbi:UNVERIFIED_CONTAM: hypothetical protein PYX00_007471 [Menopon gallinae]|uniref:Peptidase S1 domain-containing protein n=1 Tax=Menopon gallinae TaxID=328185 RepID=A0AAW2HJ69_9NEOP
MMDKIFANSFAFLVLACFAFPVLAQEHRQSPVETCIASNGQNGLCSTYSKCLSLPGNSTPAICRFQGDVALICCPLTRTEEREADKHEPKLVELEEEEEVEEGEEGDEEAEDKYYRNPFFGINGNRRNRWNKGRTENYLTQQYDNEKYILHDGRADNFRPYETEKRPYYTQNGGSDGAFYFSGNKNTYNPHKPNRHKNPGSNQWSPPGHGRPHFPENNKWEENHKHPIDFERPTTQDPRTTVRWPGNQNFNNNYDRQTQRPRTTSRWQGNQNNNNNNYYNNNNNDNDRYTYRPRTTTSSWQNQNFDRYTTQRPRTTTSRPDYNRPQNSSRKRISEIKCEEYSEPVTETISGLPLLPNPTPVKIHVQKCISAQQLIVGGENTTVGEFPHMAAIGYHDAGKRDISWKCGGSLISDQYVLTAAHCAVRSAGKPVRVRLGDYNLHSTNDGATPEDYSISEIINHPDYKPPAKYHDIALLKLGRRVNIRKNIRPACLHTKSGLPEPKVIAIGWGRVQRDEEPSNTLLKVGLSVVERNTCNKAYQSWSRQNVLPQGITENLICAGEPQGGKDTCQGDSGGPIQYVSQSNQCIHYVVGVTSFGKQCALPNSPGVYTRVSSYVPWIESVVWPGQ